MEHLTKKLRSNYRYENGKCVWVDIDVLLVPVIRELWRAGIDTMECCQGPSIVNEEQMASDLVDYSYIYFPSVGELHHFLNILTRNGEDELTDRIGHGYEYETDEGDWFYTLYIWTAGKRLGTECVANFPQNDIAEIAKRLKEYNDEKKKQKDRNNTNKDKASVQTAQGTSCASDGERHTQRQKNKTQARR